MLNNHLNIIAPFRINKRLMMGNSNAAASEPVMKMRGFSCLAPRETPESNSWHFSAIMIPRTKSGVSRQSAGGANNDRAMELADPKRPESAHRP
jgi:hypothetical protein